MTVVCLFACFQQRSVNFSEIPVIHLIEDISASLGEENEGNDDDDDGGGSTSYPNEAQSLFSSITSAASKGEFFSSSLISKLVLFLNCFLISTY